MAVATVDSVALAMSSNHNSRFDWNVLIDIDGSSRKIVGDTLRLVSPMSLAYKPAVIATAVDGTKHLIMGILPRQLLDCRNFDLSWAPGLRIGWQSGFVFLPGALRFAG